LPLPQLGERRDEIALCRCGKRPEGNYPRPVQIEINEPELLHDLCDYLSRHGFIAATASRERANVLVPDAGSDLAALLLLKARVRAWSAVHPGIKVRIDRYA
jgi:hypothetical protein